MIKIMNKKPFLFCNECGEITLHHYLYFTQYFNKIYETVECCKCESIVLVAHTGKVEGSEKPKDNTPMNEMKFIVDSEITEIKFIKNTIQEMCYLENCKVQIKKEVYGKHLRVCVDIKGTEASLIRIQDWLDSTFMADPRQI